MFRLLKNAFVKPLPPWHDLIVVPHVEQPKINLPKKFVPHENVFLEKKVPPLPYFGVRPYDKRFFAAIVICSVTIVYMLSLKCQLVLNSHVPVVNFGKVFVLAGSSGKC